jgi:hypothetical protein
MDDLLDLNWSSPSSNPASKPLTPSLQPSKPKVTGVAASSSFDFLAKSNTGSSTRTGTPNYYQSTTPRTVTPQIPTPSITQPKTQAPSNGSSGDAFSSLLGMGSSAGSSKNLTMAQKQAQILEEKRLKEEQEKAQFAGLGNWEQFSSNSSSSSRNTPLQPIPVKSANAFDGLLQPTISRPSSSASRVSTPAAVPAPTKPGGKGTFWDNDDFLAGPSKPKPIKSPAPVASSTSTPVADPWDFDQLAAVEPVRPTVNGNENGKSSGMRTPEPDFDFGEWKDMDGVGQSSKSNQGRVAVRRSELKWVVADR